MTVQIIIYTAEETSHLFLWDHRSNRVHLMNQRLMVQGRQGSSENEQGKKTYFHIKCYLK